MANNDNLATCFLSAERADTAVLERHAGMFAASPLAPILDGIVGFVLILNPQRQALFANKPFKDFLEANGVTRLIGQRPGELADCVYSDAEPNGCGTTEACLRCGAGQALGEALKGGTALNECRIMSKKAGEDLNLRVCVKPFALEKESFLLMSLADISAAKRHDVLERIFFHDILNTAGAVKGMISMIDALHPDTVVRFSHSAADATDKLIEQVLSQKDLVAAEQGTLELHRSEFSTGEFLSGIALLFAGHEAKKRKKIALAPDCQDVSFTTDKTLLLRVLVNMVKNALEAEDPGAVITLNCRKSGPIVAFTVHNPGRMPDDSRYQVFQRSFTTKGEGRGLGTYSIRLLTEKYLKGHASFTTGHEGTTFKVELLD